MIKNWGKSELVLIVWAGLALILLIPATLYLHASFPLFTVIWLVVPLLIVIRTSETARVGIIQISWQNFFATAAINLGLLLLISLCVEPWSHAYQALVRGAITGTPPDTTFAWLVRFKGLTGWGGLFLYSGVITIFGEELFFRGWLLQSFQRRMAKAWSIVIQAVLFTIPQLLTAFLLTPIQGVIYSLIYSFLGVGIIGGWAASRTQSIWPSLASATIWNMIMITWVL